MQNSSEGGGMEFLPLARNCVFPSPLRWERASRLCIPISHHGDLCTTAYSVTGKALRPLPQSPGEGWDGVPRTRQEVMQRSPSGRG